MTIKLFKDILTGIDNQTFDNGRVLCFSSFIIYFAMTILNLWVGHSWHPMDFAGGIATMGAGFGLYMKMKETTEPKAP